MSLLYFSLDLFSVIGNDRDDGDCSEEEEEDEEEAELEDAKVLNERWDFDSWDPKSARLFPKLS